MHIVVVEALLIAIYLTEKKDVYIPIQPTSLPEATSFSWGLPIRRKLGSESVNPIFENLFFANVFSNGYCRRDKGMPNGWLYHLGRHDRDGKAESRDTFGRKLACCLSVCLRYL